MKTVDRVLEAAFKMSKEAIYNEMSNIAMDARQQGYDRLTVDYLTDTLYDRAKHEDVVFPPHPVVEKIAKQVVREFNAVR